MNFQLENKNDNTEDCVTQIHQELGFMKQDILDKEDTIEQIVKVSSFKVKPKFITRKICNSDIIK